MSLIPNFPQNLLDVHHHWHDPSAHAGSPGGRVHAFGTPGGGLEFLQFHHDFVAQFHAWYDGQPFADQNAVAAWIALPAAIKNGAVTGWGAVQASQETRISTNNPTFASEDDLGTYIEGGIHGWIHGAAASAFNEPEVGTFHSPRSTYFYQIHGWVDYWWSQWKAGQKNIIKETKDHKEAIKEHKEFIKEHKDFLKDHKELVKEHKEFVKEHKEFVKEVPDKPIKEKDKDIFEGGGRPDFGVDPIMEGLARRISNMEMAVATGQAFIRPAERPDVGSQALKSGDMLTNTSKDGKPKG